MPQLHPLKYIVVISKLQSLGFMLKRKTNGSHEIWWNPTTRKTCVVPKHKEIRLGTLRNIVKQAGVSIDEFINP